MKTLIVILISNVLCVQSWLTCDEKSFCKKIRNDASSRNQTGGNSFFEVEGEGVLINGHTLQGALKLSENRNSGIQKNGIQKNGTQKNGTQNNEPQNNEPQNNFPQRKFTFTVTGLSNGNFRFTIQNNETRQHPVEQVFDGLPKTAKLQFNTSEDKSWVIENESGKLVIWPKPFRIDVYKNLEYTHKEEADAYNGEMDGNQIEIDGSKVEVDGSKVDEKDGTNENRDGISESKDEVDETEDEIDTPKDEVEVNIDNVDLNTAEVGLLERAIQQQNEENAQKVLVQKNEVLMQTINPQGFMVINNGNKDDSIALDFGFPQAKRVYGIPQHAESLSLKTTGVGGLDPYRLFNVDYYGYKEDSREALYGSIPVLYGHGPKYTSGVFWLNTGQTFVDIKNERCRKYEENVNITGNVNSTGNVNTTGNVTNTNNLNNTRNVNEENANTKGERVDAFFISESGWIDFIILTGPTLEKTVKQFAKLTGKAPLPPLFSLGYHQSRYSYESQKDVEQVVQKFVEHQIPMDVMWLDIGYTDHKKYFTWNFTTFPDPVGMQNKLYKNGKKMVAIIDPHIKVEAGYSVYDEANENNYFVKNSDGTTYVGECWPGQSSYIDFLNPKASEWYKKLHTLKKFNGSTLHLNIWNDMNEPSVFKTQEQSMPDDVVFGEEKYLHRDVHNLYGFTQTRATYHGLIERSLASKSSGESKTKKKRSTNEDSAGEVSGAEGSINEGSPNEGSPNEDSTSKGSTSELSTDEPSNNEASTNEPSNNEPSINKPSNNEPSHTEPSNNEPSTNEQPNNEPSINEPSTNKPSNNKPSTNEPSNNVHSTEEPSATEFPINKLLDNFDALRPFVLTRSHFAGSQRYAAIWTGDNLATWPHLRISIPMCLTEALAGLSFCGADIGGFTSDPEVELLQRWYQVGSWLPFFRGHSAIETKRREPYLFPKEVLDTIKTSIEDRYEHLPYWYTLFWEHHLHGTPVIRPITYHYPEDLNTLDMDSQWLVGRDILVRPVLEKISVLEQLSPSEEITKIDIYLPGGEVDANAESAGQEGGGKQEPGSKQEAGRKQETGRTQEAGGKREPCGKQESVGKQEPLKEEYWYEKDSKTRFKAAANYTSPLTIHTFPVFYRGGSIIPKRETWRNSTRFTWEDPVNLHVFLNGDGEANGTLYMDDYETFKYKDKEFVYLKLTYKDRTLTSKKIIDSHIPIIDSPEKKGSKREYKLGNVTVYGIGPGITSAVFDNGNINEERNVTYGVGGGFVQVLNLDVDLRYPYTLSMIG